MQINMELPAILEDMGAVEKIPGLITYDSGVHPGGFIHRRPFRARHFSIAIVLKGPLHLKVNLFTYELNEGDVIIIPPSAIRELDWNASEARFISLLFTSEFLQDTGIKGKYFNIARFLQNGLLPAHKMPQADHSLILGLVGILQDLLAIDTFGQDDIEVGRSIFKAILLKIKQYYDHQEADKSLSATMIYKFLQLLSENYLHSREVSFYSEKMNMNEKYLTQLLKKKTGKAAREFITDMVVLEARVLLDDHSLSIKEIADRLNFVNQFHFSRFFSQYAGKSPTQYRQQN